MGKTLCIKNFSNKRIGKFCHIVIPLHGPEVTRDTFVKMIKKKFDDKKNRDSAVIFHIDISPSVSDILTQDILLKFYCLK